MFVNVERLDPQTGHRSRVGTIYEGPDGLEIVAAGRDETTGSANEDALNHIVDENTADESDADFLRGLPERLRGQGLIATPEGDYPDDDEAPGGHAGAVP